MHAYIHKNKFFIRAFLFGILIWTSLLVSAQELISNGGFEQFSSLPNNGNQVNRLDDWEALVFTPDYLNTGFNGVIWGPQSEGAFRGTGFVGLYTLFASNNTQSGWSEAIYQELQNEPVRAGQTYRVSVSTMQSTSNSANSNCGGVSLFGFVNEPVLNGRGLIDTLPGAELLWRGPVNELSQWRTDAGTFVAPIDLNYIAISFAWQFGCSQYGFIDELSIQRDQPAFQGFSNDIAVCDSSSILLSLSNPGATYVWQDGSVDSTFLVTASGEYSVAISRDGNVFRDTILIDLQTSPSLSLPSDTVLCGATELVVDAGLQADSYQWSTGGINQVDTIRADGDVILVATVGACTVSDTFSVAFRQNVQPDLGDDLSVCAGDTIRLEVDFPSATVQWSDGSFGESLTVNTDGNFAVEVDDGFCSGSDTISVIFTELPVIYLGEDRIFCGADTIRLRPNIVEPNTTYSWLLDGMGNPYLDVTISENTASLPLRTEYTLTGERLGCIASDTISLIAARTVPVNLGPDISICEGDSTVLVSNQTIVSGRSIQWSTGATTPNLMVTEAGEYSFEVVSVDGCVTQDTVEVTVNLLPELSLPESLAACVGDTLEIAVVVEEQAGVVYQWNDGEQGASRNITATGSYTITASDGNCEATETIAAQFAEPLQLNLGPDTTLCPDDELLLVLPSSADEIRWQDGSNSIEYVVRDAGTYRVEVARAGCRSNATIQVDISNLPKDGELLGSPQVLCRDNEVRLDAGWPAAEVVWSTGETSPQIFADTPGLYAVQLNVGNCFFFDEIEVLAASPGLCAACTSYLPNAFSPNGDGVNDELRAYFENGCTVDSYSMQIFDRWGNQIFVSTDLETGWSGQMRGEQLDTGVYIAVVEYFIEGELSSKVLKENVTLLR